MFNYIFLSQLKEGMPNLTIVHDIIFHKTLALRQLERVLCFRCICFESVEPSAPLAPVFDPCFQRTM